MPQVTPQGGLDHLAHTYDMCSHCVSPPKAHIDNHGRIEHSQLNTPITHSHTFKTTPLALRLSNHRRGLAVEDFALLLLSVGEYIAARRGLDGYSKADALAGKRAEVRAPAWPEGVLERGWVSVLVVWVASSHPQRALPTCVHGNTTRERVIRVISRSSTGLPAKDVPTMSHHR